LNKNKNYFNYKKSPPKMSEREKSIHLRKPNEKQLQGIQFDLDLEKRQNDQLRRELKLQQVQICILENKVRALDNSTCIIV